MHVAFIPINTTIKLSMRDNIDQQYLECSTTPHCLLWVFQQDRVRMSFLVNTDA